MKVMKKLLFVEDDLNLSLIVVENLEDLDFDVRHVFTGEDALVLLKNELFDIVLMDVELPGLLNGFETAEKIRSSFPDLPIVFATARQSGKDMERGFNIGRMDYVKKPYRIKELSMRIEGLIGKAKDSCLYFGKLKFDPTLKRIYKGDEEISLTNLESELLQLLGKNVEKVVCRDQIIQVLWGANEDPRGKEASVHNLIYVLRKQLKTDPSILLEVVSKKGYRMTVLPC